MNLDAHNRKLEQLIDLMKQKRTDSTEYGEKEQIDKTFEKLHFFYLELERAERNFQNELKRVRSIYDPEGLTE